MQAWMASGMKEAVSRISAMFPTAIISGRARKKVQSFVDLPGLTYAGSHGMDIKVSHREKERTKERKEESCKRRNG